MINKEELINRILLLEPDFTQALLELISDYETKMIKLEKQDKILEILKRAKIDLWDFVEDIVYFDEDLYGRTAYEWYTMHYREFSLEKLSQEEFDLIVRWLRNEK